MTMHTPGAGLGMGGGRGLRSYMQDSSVTDHHLTRATLKRVMGFARPYRARLALFLGLLVLDAAAGATTPMLFRILIDDGIARGNAPLVVWLAAAAAGLALVSAGLSVAERFLSATVGEGLILGLAGFLKIFFHLSFSCCSPSAVSGASSAAVGTPIISVSSM